MRIEAITIRGFGCLTDRTYEFPRDRAVLVVEDNEAGKSTLAAAILAGLCGFPTRKRSGELMKLSEVYAPWDGRPYGVEVVLAANGPQLRVERDFARSTFVVRDAGTNRDVSSGFDTDLAAHFLRLPRDDFQRVAFISGKEVQSFGSSPNLRSRLSAVVEGAQDELGAASALAALEGARHQLNGSSIKIETAVARIDITIQERKRAITVLDAQMDSAGEDAARLGAARLQRDSLCERLAALDDEYCAARLAEVRVLIASASDAEGEVRKLETEMAELSTCASFPAERSAGLASAVARVHEREDRVQELRSQVRQRSREADEVRARLGEHDRFALATNDDMVSLEAAESSIADAQKALSEAAANAGPKAKRAPRTAGYALAAMGGATAVVGLALVAVRAPDYLPGLAAIIAGVVLAAAGLVRSSRAGAAYTAARAQLEQAEAILESARKRATERLSRLGIECEPSDDTEDTLRRARGLLSSHLASRAELRGLEIRIAADEQEIAERERGIRVEMDAVASILSDAGIDPQLPLDDAVRRFGEAESRWRRWRQVRDELLPAAKGRLAPAETVARLRSEEADLAGRTESGQPAARRSAADIDVERQAARREMDSVTQETVELERRVGACVDNYRNEYPRLTEELREAECELEKATRFGRALAKAAEVIRTVSESSYKRWADALNRQAGSILPHLNPDYDDLRFDDSLEFTIRHASDSRIIEKDEIDARLSTGAKDQVYLAVRLACCRELSGLGESIPIILDDPLIAADDTRFRSGMRYIVETLAEDHQVIILSCHRSRHESLQEEEWFERNAAIVELGNRGPGS